MSAGHEPRHFGRSGRYGQASGRAPTDQEAGRPMELVQPRTEPGERDARRVVHRGPSTTPQWSAVFAGALASGPGGYAFCVLQNGSIVSNGAWGYARMPQDTTNGQGLPFTVDTR